MATKGSAVLRRDSATGKLLVSMPSDVGRKTGLKEGDSVVVTTTSDGRIIMRAKTGSLRDLRGVTPSNVKASDKSIRDARHGQYVATDSAKKRPATTSMETSSAKKR